MFENLIKVEQMYVKIFVLYQETLTFGCDSSADEFIHWVGLNVYRVVSPTVHTG